MEIEILIDNSLHGKLYICQKDNTFFKAIITSANFTSNGLSNNNEWGVWICNVHFSRKRPSGVGIGDILIVYAVGDNKIVSITRVNSGIKHAGIKGDRWPYYVFVENLIPSYGKEWNKHNLTIFDQADEALNSGIKYLTPSGKNSFGAFRWGADKLRITEDFADFLINKIVDVDDGLGG